MASSLPFKVKAIYDYSSPHDDDLGFPTGQVITVTEEEDADWYVGEYTDAGGAKREGLFPRNFVEKYEPEVPSRPSRPARQKQQENPQPAPVADPEPEVEDEVQPPAPAASKPMPPPVAPSPQAASAEDNALSPPSASKPEPVLPALVKEEGLKKAPPPIAGKSNAFKDRIAAFNQGGAKPIAPLVPGGKPSQPASFIKKPFVAPPPSKNAYIPPVQKQEPMQKPYIREEDPEIKEREEEDRQAAEAAGFGAAPESTQQEAGEDDQQPPPQSLKERIAALQRQQAEQAQRRAEGGQKEKKPKPPVKKPSQSSELAMAPDVDGGEELERTRSIASIEPPTRQSTDRARPPVPQEPLSPRPEAPDHEIVSDGHEADQSGAGEVSGTDTDTIGPEDSDEMHAPPSIQMPRAAEPPRQESNASYGQDATEDDDEEEEDSMDDETRRKEELRARMAKISGGGGFNPFGPPPTLPTKKKSTRDSSKTTGADDDEAEATAPQRMPMMPVPGMVRVRSPESDVTQRAVGREAEAQPTITGGRQPDELPDIEDVTPEAPPRRSTGEAPAMPKERPMSQSVSTDRGIPPPVPGGRPVPPRPSAAGRAAPPLPTTAPLSPGPGSESDDEMSTRQRPSSAEMSGLETPLPIRTGAPQVPTSREPPPLPPQSPPSKRESYFNSEPSSATSDKRSSRPPPPIPGQPQSPLNSPRPPPPPPPTHAVPTRRSTDIQPFQEDATERGESDYEGDYDTDIASSAKHKEALKAPHAREPSLDDSMTEVEDTPTGFPAQRPVPPPPPPVSRPSMDAPRVPPPIPPGAGRPSPPSPGEDEDYDPYRYESHRMAPPLPNAMPGSVPPMPPPRAPEPGQDESSDDLYRASPPKRSMDRAPPLPPTQAPPTERSVPPPPPTGQEHAMPGPQMAMTSPYPAPRQSLDVHRTNTARRSNDAGRPSMSNDQGQIAQDVDLPMSSQWWIAAKPLPPSLQARNGVDILSESEESSTSKRGGRTTISKDIYVLYMDHSQTIITARYDSRDPMDVTLEQRHEPPPARPRQDQLEAFWQRFGAKIAQAIQAAGGKKEAPPLGDGSPQGLISELLKPYQDALLPVGTRAYGALVYANLANASVMQFDEIRPGDIMSMRNAKFEGKHGAMHNKYKQDYGVQHVAVVEEWDGTKKKVRAWEQGRVKAKLRDESFRLADLRSGEVRVWRVVGREFVGWES